MRMHMHTHTHTHTLTLTHSHHHLSSSLFLSIINLYYIPSNSISYNLWYISCILPCCKTISLFLLLQGLDYFQLGASLWSLETRSQPGFDPRPDDFELWFDYKPEMLKELDKQEYYSSGLVDFLYQLLDGVESRRLGISAICWDHPFLLVSGHWLINQYDCAQVFSFKQALLINLICFNSFGQKLHLVSQCTMSSEVNLYRECFSLNNDGPFVLLMGLCYVRSQVASPLNVSHLSFHCSCLNHFRYNESAFKSWIQVL